MGINAAEFDKIAREIFAPAYPAIAEQIKNHTMITKGYCLDVGCGPGHLGLALARITQLNVYLLDQLQDMIDIASKNIASEQLEPRVKGIVGDVHQIPLPDNSMDLVISRGSLFFWEDQVKAFQEIYRVLAPGGMTFIGGGFGSEQILRQIEKKMLQKDPQWSEKRQKRIGKQSIADYQDKLKRAGISTYDIEHSEAGMWIIMHKNREA